MDGTIDEIIDRQSVGSDKDFLLAALNEIYTTIQKINALKLNVSAGTNFSIIQEEMNKTANAVELTKTQLDSLNNIVKTASATGRSYASTVDELTKAQQKLQKAQSDENVALQGFKLQAQEATKAAKQQASDALGLTDAYKKLELEYNAAQRAAKNAAVEFGLGSVQQKEAAATALALSTQLKAVDASVGQNQRNVGNYGNAITGAFSKAFGAIRQIAYILPGIGIAGIFDLLIKGVEKAIQYFGLFNTQLTATEQAASILDQSMKKSTDGFQKAVVEVNALTENIALAKEGFLNKDEVLKEYNDTLGKTIGNAKDLDEAEQLLVKNGDAYIQMTLLKAAANLALDEAAKKAFEAEQARRKPVLDYEKPLSNATTLSSNSSAPGYFPDQNSINEGMKARLTAAQTAKDKVVKNAKDQETSLLGIAKDFQQQAALIATTSGFDFFGGKEDAKGGKDQKSKLDELLKARLDGLKGELQEEAKFKQSVAESDRFDQQNRILAEKQASDARIELIKQTEQEALDAAAVGYQNDLKEAKDNTANKLIAEQVYQQKRKNAIAEADRLLIDEEITTNTTLAKIKKYYQDQEKNKLAPENLGAKVNTAAQEQIAENETIKILQDGLKEKAVVTATYYVTEQAKLDKAFNTGKITQQKYQDDTIANQKAALTAQLTTLEQLIKTVPAGSNAFDALAESIANVQRQLANLKPDTPLGKLAKALQRVQADVQNVTSALSTINDIGYERQSANLQEVDAEQQKNYEKEVARINASLISQQDKAAAITQLDAEHQAQIERNANRQKELDARKAAFDRQVNIANIIAETALAVVRALGDKSVPTPVRIAEAVAIGVLGAAQIAKAIATPIPKYRTGTKDHPGGLAILGDGGKSEMVVTPSGEIFKTPATDTLYNLPEHSIVLPDASNLEDQLNAMTIMKFLNQQAPSASRNDFTRVEKKLDAVVNAIKNIPQAKFVKTWEDLNTETTMANEWQGYLDKYVKGK